MDYQDILETIRSKIVPLLPLGRPADYIPALAGVSPSKFGMALYTVSGGTYAVGDAEERFSIQSISKLFSCALAYKVAGDDLWCRTKREPSGTSFNSLVQLEYERGIPRNPFINAGALAVTDLLCSHSIRAETMVLQLLRRLSGSQTLDYNDDVARSELENSHRNRAIAHLMKS
jgi:glutaminase